jgi:hypothetical protein
MKDKNYFVDLLSKDEGLAKAVLNEFFDGISIEDALAQVDEDPKKEYTTKKQVSNVEDTVKNILIKEKVESKINKFIKDVALSAQDKEAFDREFAELIEGKKLDATNVDKYLRLAYKEALPDSDFKQVENTAMQMAQMRGGQAQTKSDVHNARKNNIEYLKSQ